MSNEDNMRTPEVFLSFYIECRERISSMDAIFNDCCKTFQRVSEFYCEKMESERIVKIVSEFRGQVLKLMDAKKIKPAKN